MWFKFRYWLPIAFVITVVFVTIYAVTQQSLRHSAYDPQIQLSEDIATTLSNGESIDQLLPPKRELTKSLAPFVIVYDKNGKVVSSTATLNGQTPELPTGVLAYTKANGQDRFTWQPADDVREATIVSYFTGKYEGYVLVGRSMMEIENRIERILIFTGLGWITAFVGSLFVTVLFVKAPKNK